MNETNNLNFLIRELVQEQTLLSILERVLGLVVDSVDIPIKNAVGYAQVIILPRGYRTSCLVSWPPGALHHRIDEQTVAIELARNLNTEVLVELSDDVDEIWVAASPDGDVRNVEIEDIEDGVDIARSEGGVR